LTFNTNFIHGQDEYYYYYQGKKVDLETDETKIDIWTDLNFDIDSLANRGFKKVSNNGIVYKKMSRIMINC